MSVFVGTETIRYSSNLGLTLLTKPGCMMPKWLHYLKKFANIGVDTFLHIPR